MMVDTQLKTSDLLSLSQQLIPRQLALAFGIALGDEHHEVDKHAFSTDSIFLKTRGPREKPASHVLKRQRDADGSIDGGPATSAAKAGGLPTSSQQTTPAPPPAVSQPAASTAAHQMTSSMQQQDAGAMAHAAASMQAAALAQQAAAAMQTTTAMAHAQAAAAAAASMQTTSSGGYPSHPAATASGGHGMLNAYRGYPAAAVGHAYHYNGHPLMPYMQAAPQAMATMSNMSGSMGCGAMSMYSDYHAMQRQDDEVEDTQARALKRPRLVWTPQLHTLFEEAVQKLGVDKAVPKTIMQMMKVEGLTRENVASHLQKYRLSLKKTADTDGKASAANVSADNAPNGTAEGSGSEKGGQEGGNGATTSTAAAGGRGSGTGGGTAVDGSSSGGDGVGSTGEGGTSTCKDKDVANGLVPRASEDDTDPADRMEVMQQVSADTEDAADGDAAAGVATGAAVAADVVMGGQQQQ